MSPKTLTTVELGERWGIHPGTLVNWRTYRRGPAYRKIGTRITYDLADVEAFELSCKIRTVKRRKGKKKNGGE